MSPQARSQKLLDQVPTRPPVLGPPWLGERRREAAARLRESGFPHRKVEAWRFTPIQPVIDVPFGPAPAGERGDIARAEELIGDDGTFRVFLVNGRPISHGDALSRGSYLCRDAPAGVEVRGLAEALAEEPAALEPHLGELADPSYFSALNGALFEDGLLVRVREGARLDRPIHVVHVGVPSTRPTACYPRLLVLCEPRSEATLLETYLAEEGEKQLVCPVAEVTLGEGAVLDHLRVTLGVPGAYHVATLAARQARDSRYASRVVTLGGGLSRLDVSVRLEGEGADCVLDGAYHAAGRDAVEHHTHVDHVLPNGSSNECYRGILDGRGQAVFDGAIIVRPNAQHTSAHQENRNLLLSDDASVNTKPHLEIEADDVSCSHGATIGALDEDQLFYLRARGLSLEQAEATLTYAFVREVIDRVPHAPSRRRLAAALLERLPHGETIGGEEVSA